MKGLRTSDKIAIGGFVVLGVGVFVSVGYLSYQAETDPSKQVTLIREQQRQAEEAKRIGEAHVKKMALEDARRSFAPWVKPWLESADLKMAPPGQKVQGKAVVVDRVAGIVDELHMELPADLRASGGAEVKVIVWLQWDRGASVRLSEWDTGWPTTCTVTIIDPSRRQIVAQKLIEGVLPAPRRKLKDHFESQGPKPSHAVLFFLTSQIGPTEVVRDQARTSAQKRVK